MCNEKFIEEKAKELLIKANILIQTPEAMQQQLKILKDFIRLLYESMPAKKATVSEEFVERWADKFDGIAQQGLIIDIDLLKKMLIEAGVEVKK